MSIEQFFEKKSSDDVEARYWDYDTSTSLFLKGILNATNFMRSYVNDLHNGKVQMAIGENLRKFPSIPIIFFYDFVFFDNGEGNIRDYMNMVYLARYTGVLLKNFVDCGIIDILPGNDDDYRCILTSSNDYVFRDPYYHFFVRMQFPQFRVDGENAPYLYGKLYKEIASQLASEKIIGSFNGLSNYDWNDILINPFVKEIVPLFGVDIDGKFFGEKLIGVIDCMNNDDPDDILSLQSFLDYDAENVQDVYPLKEHYVGRYLTREIGCYPESVVLILSLSYGGIENVTISYNPQRSLLNSKGNFREDLYIRKNMNDIQKLRVFIELIDGNYWSTRSEWLILGNVIYNTYNNTFSYIDDYDRTDKYSQEGLELWQEITTKYTDFDPEDCVSLYFNFDGIYTIKTIAWIARQENMEGYQMAMNRLIRDIIEEICHNPTLERTVAELYYNLNWLNIITHAEGNRTHWKYFQRGKWIKTSKQTMSENLFKGIDLVLTKYASLYSKKLIQEGIDNKPQESPLTRISAYRAKLQKLSWDNSLVNWLSNMSYLDNFGGLINKNPNIMAFDNKYLEFIGDNIVARPGRPEDLVTIYSRCKVSNLSWDNKDVIDFMKWADQMYPDPELRDYVLKIFASCLCSTGNKEKIFPIMVSGDNLYNRGNEGKTTWKNLMDKVFGDYSVTAHSKLFMPNNGSANNAEPALAIARNAHILWINEVSSSSSMDDGMIKHITGGNERIFTRLLWSNDNTFTVGFIPIMICNQIPDFKNVDQAIKNRTKIIPHFSRWAEGEDEVPETVEEQYKKRIFLADPTFEEKHFHRLAPAALWVLIQYYPRYIREGLKTPQIVKDFTARYWESKDPYKNFIKESIEYGDEYIISTGDIYLHFRDWVNNTNWMKKVPPKDHVLTAIAANLPRDGSIELGDRVWKGLRVKKEEIMGMSF